MKHEDVKEHTWKITSEDFERRSIKFLETLDYEPITKC
jgi:hypothetical protein